MSVIQRAALEKHFLVYSAVQGYSRWKTPLGPVNPLQTDSNSRHPRLHFYPVFTLRQVKVKGPHEETGNGKAYRKNKSNLSIGAT